MKYPSAVLILTYLVICFAPVNLNIVQARNYATQATNSYLAEFPSVQRVRAELKGSNSVDTAARQMGAFWQFGQVIRKLARYYRSAAPDQNRLMSQYGMAYGALDQYYSAYPDRPKWSQLHAFYENDETFLDQLLQQFFSPEFRAAYYQAIGKAVPPARRIEPTVPGGRVSTDQAPVAAGPSRAEVNRDLGNREYEAGQKFYSSRNEAEAAQSFKRAKEYYKAAIALDPQITGVYYGLGSCYFKEKQYELALSMWKKFRAQKPENIPVLTDMSRAYRALHQYQQALPLVQEGLRRNPGRIDSVMLYDELGSIYYGLGEYEKALAAYDELTRIDPFFTPHFLMGDAYYQLQRYPEAANSYNRAIDEFQNNANAYYRLALTYMRMGKKDEALGVYNRLLGVNPKRAQELYTLIYKGSAPTSLADIDMASPAPSGNASPPTMPTNSTTATAKTYTDLGFTHYKAKEYAKAIEAYEKALSLNPDLFIAHLFLGTIYLKQERWELALPRLKRALALRPDDSVLGGLLIQMAAAQRELKQYDEALDTYRNQLRVKPTAGAHYWMGWIYSEKKGQYDKAVPEFREALRLQPDDTFSAYFLGDAYYHLKQYSNAVTAFREAIRLKPDYAEAERYLGITFLALGQRNAALQTYQTLLSMDKQKAQELLTEINKTPAP